MPLRFQVTIDCRDPVRMTEFWAEALGYEVEPPPAGFADWDDYWRSIGIPEEELGLGSAADRLRDPAGAGPSIWFQVVDEPKTVKNRLHFDLSASGGRTVPLATRRERVEAMADRLVRRGATRLQTYFEAGVDHYAVAMLDPEGNEFDIF